jgi:hypothetical protein
MPWHFLFRDGDNYGVDVPSAVNEGELVAPVDTGHKVHYCPDCFRKTLHPDYQVLISV